MRSIVRSIVGVVVGLAALLAATAPAVAITGGQEDTDNTYSNVGLVLFYQPDGRFRCTGTLVEPRVVLTAAHCTFQDIGKVAVTFDPRDLAHRGGGRARSSRGRADDTGPDDARVRHRVHRRRRDATELRGRTAVVPRHRRDASAVQRFHRPQELERHRRDHPRRSTRACRRRRSHRRTISTSSRQPRLQQDGVPHDRIRHRGAPSGVGTADTDPATPTDRPPLHDRDRAEADEPDPPDERQRARPAARRRHLLRRLGWSGRSATASSSATRATASRTNCRYLDGYQRVDIPIVRDWLLDCFADLTCPTKA